MENGKSYVYDSEHLRYIDDTFKKIIENWKFANELIRLLWEGVESHKLWFHHASVSVLTVVLEKYLRDTLIWCEFNTNREAHKDMEHMEYLEMTEEAIEDWKNGNNKKYMFEQICDALVEYDRIEPEDSEWLKQLYKELRIPVQHGIYARLVKSHLWSQACAPMRKIELGDVLSRDEILEKLQWPLDGRIPLYNPLVRQLLLPGLMKDRSTYILGILVTLTVKISKTEAR